MKMEKKGKYGSVSTDTPVGLSAYITHPMKAGTRMHTR